MANELSFPDCWEEVTPEEWVYLLKLRHALRVRRGVSLQDIRRAWCAFVLKRRGYRFRRKHETDDMNLVDRLAGTLGWMWVVDDEKTAKEIVDGRIEKDKIAHAADRAIKSFDTNALKDLNVIIKADVQGSAEALKSSIAKLANEEAKVNIVHCGVGAINKSDMMLAEVTDAYVIGFNVKPDAEARIIAEHSGIRNGTFSVIYDAIDAIEAALSGMTEPKYEDRYTGKAEVRNIFRISGVGAVAGSYVLDGKIQRGSKVVVKRGGKTVFEGKLAGLKRFKDDVKEVAAGFECGISVEGYSDFAEGDEIEAYISERVK